MVKPGAFVRGVLAVVTAGCQGCAGYQSSYVPLDDGYARLVWQGTRVTAVGSFELPSCVSPDYQAMRHPGPVQPARLQPGTGSEPDPWFLTLHRVEVDAAVSGESNDGSRVAAVALLAAATVAAAGASIAIAAAPVGDPKQIAETIDAVNHHNDEVSWRRTQCPDPSLENR